MFYVLLLLLLLFICFIYYIRYILVYPGSLIKDYAMFNKKMEILEIDGHKSYYIKPIDDNAEGKLWIFFTGNNMIARTYYKIARKIQKNNKNDIMLLFEYPSYGINNKNGLLSMHTIDDHITKFIKYLKKLYTFDKINLFAWSLGCAIALKYANLEKVNNIYLLSPFTTFQDAINNVLGGFPLHHILDFNHRWDNLESIMNVKAEHIEIFHGTLDKTVPFDHGLQLFQSIPQKISKKFIKLEGANHNILKLIDYNSLK